MQPTQSINLCWNDASGSCSWWLDKILAEMAISDTQLTVLSLICLLFFSTARPSFSQITAGEISARCWRQYRQQNTLVLTPEQTAERLRLIALSPPRLVMDTGDVDEDAAGTAADADPGAGWQL
jgi:hypothetical protein